MMRKAPFTICDVNAALVLTTDFTDDTDGGGHAESRWVTSAVRISAPQRLIRSPPLTYPLGFVYVAPPPRAPFSFLFESLTSDPCPLTSDSR